MLLFTTVLDNSSVIIVLLAIPIPLRQILGNASMVTTVLDDSGTITVFFYNSESEQFYSIQV